MWFKKTIFAELIKHHLSGIYIHIPYCTKACFYCDFHFSVNKKGMPEMTEAIIKELIYFGKKGSKDFFNSKPIETIYFGGGTPSVLPIEDINSVLETVYKNYNIEENPEITLEANPDDLTIDYCRQLKLTGINRLSIGIQSFYDEHLKWMNRSHDSGQAESCVNNAITAGIDNISIDLIYGFPGLSDKQWNANLQKAQNLPINHLSCYCLTVEERTPLKKLIETGRYIAPDEDLATGHFNKLTDWAKENKWEHYEISNFCRNGFYSKHNTGYWQQKLYLGIGPSAHSYNSTERRWNVKDNNLYVESWQQNSPYFEVEILTTSEKLNDYILTSLRTQWGLDIKKANEISGIDFKEENKELIDMYVSMGLLKLEGNILKLTDEGKLYADGIAAEFFGE
ncbi:MAG: radical SAM family heme chaperone HemW [Bacteroidia bacterium]